MPTDFHPMTAAELFDRTLYVFKKSFWMQIAYAAMLGVISSFGIGIFGVIIAIALFGSGGGTFVGATIITALILLWLAASSAGHILLARQALYGHKAKIPVKQIPRIAIRVFFTLIAQVIAAIPYVSIMVIIALPFSAMVYVNIWVFVILIFIAVAGFGLYYNIFALAIAVSVFENKTFFGALMRSWELIKGEFWRIAAVRLMWLLIAYALTFSIQGALQLLALLIGSSPGLFGLNSTALVGLSGALSGFSILLSFITAIIAMPLDGVFSATLYFNQRIKREGLDIEIGLGRLRL